MEPAIGGLVLDSSVLVAAERAKGAGGQQAAKGIKLPFIDLTIGACALELGYAIGTDNVRDLR